VFVFANSAIAQEKTCGVVLKVVDAAQKKEIPGAYAEAYESGASKTFHASELGSDHTFENLNSTSYHFTVQKRGYKVSRYFLDLNCAKAGVGGKISILVPLHEGDIREQENVTPQTAEDLSGPPRDSGKSLTKNDIARLSNYLNKIATRIAPPTYPLGARAVRAGGAVLIHVIVNEAGDVDSAEVVFGHPLLRDAAKKAAQKSKFKPTLIGEKAIRIQGFLVYNFVS
jgi:TonB family protein